MPSKALVERRLVEHIAEQYSCIILFSAGTKNQKHEGITELHTIREEPEPTAHAFF